MSRAPSIPMLNLAQDSGQSLFSAPEAILKGTLESELEISVITGPSVGAFSAVIDLAFSGPVKLLLRQHNTRVIPTPDAARAITLAGYAAKAGRASIAMLPNDQIDQTMSAISQVMSEPLDRGGAMCLVFEDNPKQAAASCPRRAAARLGLPCLEPANVEQLRHGIESVLRLSRAGRCPIGLVVHTSVLRSADT